MQESVKFNNNAEKSRNLDRTKNPDLCVEFTLYYHHHLCFSMINSSFPFEGIKNQLLVIEKAKAATGGTQLLPRSDTIITGITKRIIKMNQRGRAKLTRQ
jgi:hypothetical protein